MIAVVSLCVSVGRDIRGLTGLRYSVPGSGAVLSVKDLRDVEIGMNRRVALSVAVLASTLLTSAYALAEPRAVIELFTSQGCSSCPPADKLAGELSRDPSLIVMSLAVDYWDYLGWNDTLALPGHTNRQRAYSRTRGDREVYTPQVVVNGDRRTCSAATRAAIDNAITTDAQATRHAVAAGDLSVASERDLRRGAGRERRARQGRDLALSDDRDRPGADRARRKLRTHVHVSQRRAALDQAWRLDRHGTHVSRCR